MTHSQISGVKIADRDSVNEWVTKREGTIGSSSIANCYPGKKGLRIGFESVSDFYQKLRGFVSEREPNNAMLTGVILQPSVEHFVMNSKYFKSLNAARVPDASEVLFRHKKYPRLTATPDMVIEIDDGKGGREAVIVEIKTTSRLGSWRIKSEGEGGYMWRVPQRVFLQLQHQLDVLGLKKGYVVCYPLSTRTGDMDEPIWISPPIDLMPEIIAENHKWANAMLTCYDNGVAPLMSDEYKDQAPENLGDVETLKKMRLERTVEATPDILTKIARASQMKSEKNMVGKEYKDISEEVRAAFGLCDEMVDDKGDVIATYKGGDIIDEELFRTTLTEHKVKLNGESLEQLILSYPALAEQCITTSSSRRLWIK